MNKDILLSDLVASILSAALAGLTSMVGKLFSSLTNQGEVQLRELYKAANVRLNEDK